MSRHESRRSQEERRDEAERRLLDAAAELIGEVGPSKVTLAAIGERAGYSRGLATHHFGSKPALMERLVDSVTDRFREVLRPDAPAASTEDAALDLIRTYFAVLADLPAPNRARLLLWADAAATASADARPAMISADRVFREEITRVLERGKAIGEIPDSVTPGGLATVIIGMLRGVALESMLDDTVDLDACRAEAEQLITTRLAGRRSGSDSPDPERSGTPDLSR
ncbi:TetR/AcrR family transcriptional regulator [Saccharopolyspora sp. NFXS83]|uniref:TetR/AcrR family transcriptional regulator n=1 Tax=Saccharopolyspora sp. NFXS83 TaxID=2993560 RepID=UPI00224B1FBB|nr:TetR/AcrR family transcriptional regulator [Saccharopolyspora sp. NFXS83]MCX2729734.1 TetR/AcrR family transcriptional regulator [Saccharopolyspora sp. NFXS83]